MNWPSEGELVEIGQRAERLYRNSTDDYGEIKYELGAAVSEDVEMLLELVRRRSRSAA